jgi:hypothetical protein
LETRHGQTSLIKLDLTMWLELSILQILLRINPFDTNFKDIDVNFQLYKIIDFKGEVWLSPVPSEIGWRTCDDTDENNEDEESNNCANTVPFGLLSMKTHISYWTRRDSVLCAFDPLKRSIDVEFLPLYFYAN